MAEIETDLQMAQRHVREGEEHLASQRQVIVRLGEQAHPTEEAEKLLAQFEDIQRLHLEHVARLTEG